jgi:hypothetical protein
LDNFNECFVNVNIESNSFGGNGSSTSILIRFYTSLRSSSIRYFCASSPFASRKFEALKCCLLLPPYQILHRMLSSTRKFFNSNNFSQGTCLNNYFRFWDMRELKQPQCLAGNRLPSVLLVSFQVVGQYNSLGRVQNEGRSGRNLTVGHIF